MRMNKYIEFNLGAEKQIRVAKAGRADALFYEGYRQGLAGVIEIVRASTLYTQHRDCVCPQSDSARCHPAYDGEDYYNYPNNMIVFTGGRGTGKSSAMLTFVSSLTDPSSELFKETFLQEVVSCELPGLVKESPEQTASLIRDLMGKSKFVSIPPIDPTMLEDGGQILVNILARMFQKAEVTWEHNKSAQGDRLDLNEKNELMHQFTVCYECANALKNKNAHQALDPLDLLSDLGDSSNLKRQLVQLVKKLLRFVVKDSWDDTYLVLQIDDTDMNIRQAYNILEDIRKYLVIPRLIIVMAADLDHLSRVVESSLLGSYGQSLSGAGLHARGIAGQYISKLVPQSRRICLPELEVYLQEHPDTEIRYSTPFSTILPDNSPFPDSQEQIFRLIYRKTGLVFLRQEHQLHYIIPGNMRLLGYFLAMLVQMKDVANPDDTEILSGAGFFLTTQTEEKRAGHLKNLQTRLQNIQRFRDYFLDVWAVSALSEENAQRLRRQAQANLVNKASIICGGVRPDETRRPGYVDMLRMLRMEEHQMNTEEDKRYIYAVHILISLLGHSIVLEELIAHYGIPDWKETDCVFKRLYPLFGSRLFSYFQDDGYYPSFFLENDGEKKASWVRDTDNMEEVPMGERLCAIMLPFANDHNRWLPIRWQVPSNMDMPSELRRVSTNPRTLYSLFCPYSLSEEDSDIWGDLTTPILNCLYLSPSECNSPLSEAAVTSAFHVALEPKDQWTSLQSSALLVVLNWDIQRKLGEYLMSKLRFPDKPAGGLPFNFVSAITTFYQYLTTPFKKGTAPMNTEELTGEELKKYMGDSGGQSSAPTAQGLPIACLGALNPNLYSWVESMDEKPGPQDEENTFGESGNQPENTGSKLSKEAKIAWTKALCDFFYPFWS